MWSMRTTVALLAVLWLGCLFGPRTPSGGEQQVPIQVTNQTQHPICHIWQSVTIWDGHVGQYAAARPAVVAVLDAKSPKDCLAPNGSRTAKVYEGFAELAAFEDAAAPKPAPSVSTFDWRPGAGPLTFVDPSKLDERALADRSTPIAVEARARRTAEVDHDKLLNVYDVVVGALHVIETVPKDSNDLRKAGEIANKAMDFVDAGIKTLDQLGPGGPAFTTKDGKTFDPAQFRATLASLRETLKKDRRDLHDQLERAYGKEYGARGVEILDLMADGPPTRIEGGNAGGRDHRKAAADKTCYVWESYYDSSKKCYASDGKRLSQEVSHPHPRPQAPTATASAPAESAPSDSSGGACMPKSCSELRDECGSPPDGCGRTLDCGQCASYNVCKEMSPGDGLKCWNR